MFQKNPIIIDARGHLLGRLASILAKELLCGQKFIVVRCEEIEISGPHKRNKAKFLSFLRKRTSTQPSHGPEHFRAPSKILWRTVRGMLPHKTPRGASALRRLKVFEGIPPPYDKKKRNIVPDALRVLRIKPYRKTTILGKLSSQVGWNHGELINQLENKRKAQTKEWYNNQKKIKKLREKAQEMKKDEISSLKDFLKDYGY
ncbi:60S ribosomal protein L13A-RELATED [Anaeramoeba ignava]|uniref:60S ribosomal protein L13A-RELATED n=1 Tax=Anaeramoeba ignava TaxID=1746090 RepID=A0A9Q0RH16_ANAIG|nr:60S ribosomal protein L13A-RELATED [Anaeramoeba ignava]|eukprot:Anaeramoba_ignava/a222237_400.p1 GENE.a222237_400~~a222237_400.p1  ORF type:complete len:202 (+),score=59.01 a222237_400:13-618(+)